MRGLTKWFGAGWRRSRRFKTAAILAGVLAITVAAYAIQTNEVELGFESLFDGTVFIRRDVTGRMTFQDNEVTTPVTLATLDQGVDTHAALLGLAADDHPQYQDATRHGAVHTGAFNAAMPIDPDVGGNTTLGGHLLDGGLHLERDAAETIGGNWVFTGIPEFRDDVYLSVAGGPGDQRIRFEDGATDAEIGWNDAANRFELNRNLHVDGAGVNSFAGLVRLDDGAAGSNDSATGGGDLYVEDHLEVDNTVTIATGLGIGTTSTVSEITLGATTSIISPDTINAADSKSIGLIGGGGSGGSRGAGVFVYGNEHASEPGHVLIKTGNSTGADIELHTANPSNNLVLRVIVKDSSGFVGIGSASPATQLDVAGDVTMAGAIDQNGAGVNTFAGEAEFSGGIEVDTIQGLAGTTAITIAGADATVAGDLSVVGATEMDGDLRLKEVATPSTQAGTAVLYAQAFAGTTEMFIKDGGGNSTQISSHNFGGFQPDPADPYPFSLHASNEFIGKAMWADLTGALRAIERLTGEQFVFHEDLPTSRVLNYEQWRLEEKRRLEREEREARLARDPEIEIAAAEAWAWVEAVEEIIEERPERRYVFDPETGRAIERVEMVTRVRRAGAGRNERRLKPGVRLDAATGKFYRRRRPEEVGPIDIPAPTLPDWVIERLAGREGEGR